MGQVCTIKKAKNILRNCIIYKVTLVDMILAFCYYPIPSSTIYHHIAHKVDQNHWAFSFHPSFTHHRIHIRTCLSGCMSERYSGKLKSCHFFTTYMNTYLFMYVSYKHTFFLSNMPTSSVLISVSLSIIITTKNIFITTPNMRLLSP